MSTIDGAFADTPLEDLQRLLEAAQKGMQQVQSIDAYLDEKVGVGKAPDLKPFLSVMQEAAKVLQGYVASRTGGATAEAGGQEASPGGGGGTGGAALAGDVSSPRDVLLALDKICRYYERSEVSSPVPFILKAAKRMVSKNFVDIAKIMTPEAIRTVEEMGKEEVPGG
jgi:type VI secretion system protein ImpA